MQEGQAHPWFNIVGASMARQMTLAISRRFATQARLRVTPRLLSQ